MVRWLSLMVKYQNGLEWAKKQYSEAYEKDIYQKAAYIMDYIRSQKHRWKKEDKLLDGYWKLDEKNVEGFACWGGIALNPDSEDPIQASIDKALSPFSKIFAPPIKGMIVQYKKEKYSDRLAKKLVVKQFMMPWIFSDPFSSFTVLYGKSILRIDSDDKCRYLALRHPFSFVYKDVLVIHYQPGNWVEQLEQLSRKENLDELIEKYTISLRNKLAQEKQKPEQILRDPQTSRIWKAYLIHKIPRINRQRKKCDL